MYIKYRFYGSKTNSEIFSQHYRMFLLWFQVLKFGLFARNLLQTWQPCATKQLRNWWQLLMPVAELSVITCR